MHWEEAWRELSSRVPIIHLHGVIAPYPAFRYGETHKIPKESKDGSSLQIISEISETEDAFCTPDFEHANRLLSDADQVISLGFAFGEANVRRLKFFAPNNACGKPLKIIVGEMRADALQAAKSYIVGCTGSTNIYSGRCAQIVDSHSLFA